MAYENLSREELISALETLTGVDQFAAGAATDPNVGGASVVPPPRNVPSAFVDTFNEFGGQGTYSGIPSGTVLADSFQFPYEAGGKQAVTGGFDWSGPGDTNEQYTLPPIEASAPGSIGKKSPLSFKDSLSCFLVTHA